MVFLMALSVAPKAVENVEVGVVNAFLEVAPNVVRVQYGGVVIYVKLAQTQHVLYQVVLSLPKL